MRLKRTERMDKEKEKSNAKVMKDSPKQWEKEEDVANGKTLECGGLKQRKKDERELKGHQESREKEKRPQMRKPEGQELEKEALQTQKNSQKLTLLEEH